MNTTHFDSRLGPIDLASNSLTGLCQTSKELSLGWWFAQQMIKDSPCVTAGRKQEW